MLRKIYDWVFAQARRPNAEKVLAVVSFAEASFFPVPPDVMLAPMVLSRPEKAYRFALICSIASVAGGALGWAIGYFLTDVGVSLMRLLGHADGLEQFQHWYDQFGVWVILAKGFTPIPYKLVTIASGLAHFNFAIFMIASVVTRSGRFFLEAWVLKTWGAPMLAIVEKRLALFSVLGLALLIGGFMALKLLDH